MVLEYVDFITGAISVGFAYAIFKSNEDEQEDILDDEDPDDFTGRHVTLSCQSCRKLKTHREVEPDLYQCTKCKRHVDLR